MDRGAWWATVHRVRKSWTQLKRLTAHTHTQNRELVGTCGTGSSVQCSAMTYRAGIKIKNNPATTTTRHTHKSWFIALLISMLSIFLCWLISGFQPDLPHHRAGKRHVKLAPARWWGPATHPPICRHFSQLQPGIEYFVRGVIFCYNFDKKHILSCLLPHMLGVVPSQVEGLGLAKKFFLSDVTEKTQTNFLANSIPPRERM